MTDILETKWLTDAPALPSNLPQKWQSLWDAGWRLHVQSCQAPRGVFDDVWETVGSGYIHPAFGHWDLVHSVIDILSYDVQFGARQLRLLLNLMRESDGALPYFGVGTSGKGRFDTIVS